MTPSSVLRSRNVKGLLLLFIIVGLGLVIYFRNVMRRPVDIQSLHHSSLPTISEGGEESPTTESSDHAPSLIILPQQPLTTEGNSLQITCISPSDPPTTVKFNTSSLPRTLQSHIHLYEQPGLSVITFEDFIKEWKPKGSWTPSRSNTGHHVHCAVYDLLGSYFENSTSCNSSVCKLTHTPTDVLVGHEGVYTCRAVGSNGETVEDSVKVTVLHKGEVAEMREVTEASSNSSVTMATNSPSVPMATNQSEVATTSFEQRGKVQQEQVEKYCQKYEMSGIKYKLPQSDQYAFNRHMLLNDQSKTLFCFVPKVGCTNLKVLFYVSQGFIPESELTKSRDSVNQGALERAMSQHSFTGLTTAQKEHHLTHYFKFMMYRNPLLRLVSGYRSKVQRFPLVGFKPQTPHYNWLRLHTYQYKHPEEYKKWKAEGGTREVNISFSDFIDYWLSGPHELRGDEHFRPITELCHPCRVRFDFYGNFNNFAEDSTVLIEHVGAKSDYLRDGYYTETTTTGYLSSSYYDTLNEAQRKSVFNKLAVELDFYYHLFPEELDVHKQILRIADDIPEHR